MHTFYVFCPFFATNYLDCHGFLSQCWIYQTDQRQKYVWMEHQNVAFKCFFLIARELTKRQRVHLLTVSQRECKEITKTAFYFGAGSFLRFPLHSARDSSSVTDVICLFHLVTEQGGSTLHSPCPWRLDLTQNTHLCVFFCLFLFFISDCSGHLAVFKIIASF